MLGHHPMNIFRPCILQDVWRSEILPNRHVIPTWQSVFPGIFFSIFENSCNLYDTNIFYELMTNEILIIKIKNNYRIVFVVT
jgi:hypothetical protein